MLLLTSVTDKLQMIAAAGTIDVHASYVDYDGSTVTPGRRNTSLSGAGATTDIVLAPASLSQRNIKVVHIRNKHATTSSAITVQHTDGSTPVELFKCTLLAGEELIYLEGLGFMVYDATGGRKAFAPAPYSVQILTAASGTYTTPTGCRAIWVRLVGGGGAGGGAATAASSGGAGGGGGAGSYCEKHIASPLATYAFVNGAGGTAGTAGNNPGNNGADTTFGTSLLTAKGATGGAGMAAGTTVATALGGAGGVAGTGGDLNSPGPPGEPGIRATGLLGVSGAGGNSMLGPGANGLANATGAGVSAVANTGGGGGGGEVINAGTAQAGGVGGSGAIIVVEYF